MCHSMPQCHQLEEEEQQPGELLSPKLYMDVPAGPQKFDFLFTNFLPKLPTHQCTILNRKTPNFTQMSSFYNIFAK